MNNTNETNGKGKAAKVAAGVTAVTIAGGIAYSLLNVKQHVPLPLALEAERHTFESPRAGQLSYYVDSAGSGKPLVLVHSINAAPSAFEMRPLFAHYRGQRPVYALDLPGFGFSDRSDRRYSPQLYAAAIADFLADVVGDAADVVALSLGCEFAAQAALLAAAQIRSLALISPTGLSPLNFVLPGDLARQIFAFPLWGQPLFNLVTSKGSISLFTGQSFVGEPPQDFLDYAYATSHQPGASHAPYYFLSGQLFREDVRTAVYEKLSHPTLVLYDKDPNIDFSDLPKVLEKNKLWQAERITPTRGLPHWEALDRTAAALDDFWAGL